MSSSSSRITSIKILLTSVTFISLAVTLKLTVPLMLNTLPTIWSVILTWLKPPYLYVIINAIILTIVASTRFQHDNNNNQPHETHQQVNYHAHDAPRPLDMIPDLLEVPTVELPVVYESKRLERVAVNGPEVVKEVVATRPNCDTSHNDVIMQSEVEFPVNDKQLVSSRFAHTRRPLKASPEVLRVLKPKKHETLESTWKMITDGRQLPLNRHLRKSDTFDNRPSEELTVTTVKKKAVKKSETFKDRTTSYANQNEYPHASPVAGGKLKKDGSLSHDELNRRVEAFIKKFNDDMRLQRQESLNQYREMVNSGPR